MRALEPGKPIARELTGGETHVYQFTLAAGQYARVGIEQRRINIVVSAFDADGKKLIEADMFGMGDSESISLAAAASATYRLEVRSPDRAAPAGSYEIKIKEQRAATEQDRSAVAAERLVAEGAQLYAQPTADSWRKAIEKYQQSIPLWQTAQNPGWEATALYMIGNLYIALGNRQKALDISNQALPVAQAAAKQTDQEQQEFGVKAEAYALDTLGRAHNSFGDKKKAIELFNQALLLRQATRDRVGEINTLNNLGMTHGSMGEPHKALAEFNQALRLLGELGDRRKEATMLGNICVIHNQLGEYKTAIDFCQQSLALKRGLQDRPGEAATLDNIGTIYSSSGEYQKALDSHLRSLAIFKETKNRTSEAISLNNIGWVYATLGDYEKAIEYYNQALEPLRDLGDKNYIAVALNNIAVNHAKQKDFRKALDLHTQVLALRRDTGDKDGEALALNNIANCHQRLGEKQQALDYYTQALALLRAVGNPRQLAIGLRNLGDLHREMGEQQKAIDYFNEGLQLSRAIGDPNNEAATLALLARLARDRGNADEARQRIEAAIAAFESLRINVKSHQLRASFFASARQYYEFDIDTLMRLHQQRPSEGFDAAALQASEKSRARSLLELLAEAGAEIRRDVDPALIERERALRQQIADQAERQMRLLSGKHTAEQAAAAAKELDNLTTEYEQTQAQIRQASPRYAALIHPAPLTLKAIQSEVLDSQTLLLEYALGEERSFLWAVTPDSIRSYQLPGRAEIEAAARHVYQLLTVRNQTIAGETPERRRQRFQQAESEYPQTAAALSRMLLGPVADELKQKRLLIIGEGALQYLPFGALPAPQPKDEGGRVKDEIKPPPASSLILPPSSLTSQPLIVDHEIISLPSASVMAVLRREAAGRKAADKTVAVFADPVFDRNDPRVRLAGRAPAPAARDAAESGEVKRSAAESGLQDFVRLRFSRQEADQIMRMASANKTFAAVDFAANLTAATKPELGDYAILHFATHGLINNQHPELSGVVLSLVDQQGRPQNGFLRLYDIYNLKLEADLVVLSACQTTLGKEIKGEGLVGLTRGFMYAGAPRVVASLWQVDDRATAELMGRFYDAMLRQGLRPAAALRAAQVSMWKDKRWQALYNWAAFTLQGEWQ